MGKWYLHASWFIFDRIIIKVAGYQDRHKSSDEFDFGPLVSMAHLYVFEMRFDLGTLDSGERSLPFGLLVFCCFFSWLSPLNSNFILLADFPFQWPVYLSCIIIQSTSIPLAYHLFIILTLKILPNSIFSIFLFCPLWHPIIILHLVSSLGYITLSTGYNSQSIVLGERKSFNSKSGDQH